MILKHSQKEPEVGVICRIRIGFIIINLLSKIRGGQRGFRACACILRLRLNKPWKDLAHELDTDIAFLTYFNDCDHS